jgi:hypothetical protein
MSTPITRETAEAMGRAAAHMEMSAEQLAAMFQALGYTATARIARYAELERRATLRSASPPDSAGGFDR